MSTNLTRSAQIKRIAEEPEMEYLKTASLASLKQLVLSRMSQAANAQKQITDLLAEVVNDLVLAELARLLSTGAVERLVQGRARATHAPKPAQQGEGEQQQALEAFAEGGVLEPFFRPPALSAEMRRQLDVPQRQRWLRYFGQYGCLVCGRGERGHHSCGMCEPCYARTQQRLGRIASGTKPRPQGGRRWRKEQQ